MLRACVVLLFCLATVSLARACPTVPTFSTRIERASLPARPASPVNGGGLETYRIDWEAARAIKIEGFNRRRNSFAGRLESLRTQIAAAVAAGECTQAEASKAQSDIDEGLRLVWEDMQFEYDELMLLYSTEVGWYKVMIAEWKSCRALGRCQEGYDYV